MIKKKLRANQSSSMKGERQTPLSINEDIDEASLEQPLDEADYAPDIQRETDTETGDDDWLNNGVPEASASTIKKEDDDWLNAGLEEAPANVYKQQDDYWPNTENNQPLETVGESSLNCAPTNRPEIQIKQDGSILNITVKASNKQEIKSEQTVINLKINVPPQYLARKGEGPYDIEITTNDSSPSNQSLQDILTVKPVEEPVNQSHLLMDEISVRPVENQVTESHALMDEICIKHSTVPVLISPQLIDEISRPVENQVTESNGLMDEINVRPVESPVIVSSQLMDGIYVRPVENQVTESDGLMDEVSIKPSLGPVNIEYELLDDLITKSATYRSKKAKPSSVAVKANPVESPIVEKAELSSGAVIVNPVESPIVEKAELSSGAVIVNPVESPIVEKAKPSSGAVIVNPVESPIVEKAKPSSGAVIVNPVENRVVEKAEPVKTVSFNEITEYLNEKKVIEQATIPSLAIESRSTKSTRIVVGSGKLPSRTKSQREIKLPGAVTKALAALRIFNNNEFYIQDTDITQVDTLIQKPQIKDFTFKVLNTATELDELIDGGYDLVMNFNKIKRGLKKGMVAFLFLVDGELASMGWACMTEESKAIFRGYPYNDDLDRQACIVGDWTNPKYRDSGISSYVKHKRQQLLKEKGFTFERSIVEDSIAKDLRSTREQKRFDLTYKRRTYTNVCLPGILGVEFWKEHLLNEKDTKPLYQMITLLVLVLPSPRMVADLNIKPKVLKLNWI